MTPSLTPQSKAFFKKMLDNYLKEKENDSVPSTPVKQLPDKS